MSSRTTINQVWDAIEEYAEARKRELDVGNTKREEKVFAANKLDKLLSKLEDEVEAKVVQSLINQLNERIK